MMEKSKWNKMSAAINSDDKKNTLHKNDAYIFLLRLQEFTI